MSATISTLMILRIIIALFFGAAIGFERVIHHKAAGMRTYALVAIAAASFVVLSELVIHYYLAAFGGNFAPLSLSPVMIAANVVLGVGFLGGGLIVHTPHHVDNLTTASALWAAAAIGVACGFGYMAIALAITVCTLFILSGMRSIENWIKKHVHIDLTNDDKAH